MKIDIVLEPEGRQISLSELNEILISVRQGGRIRIWKSGDHSDLAIHIDTSDGDEVLVNGNLEIYS